MDLFKYHNNPQSLHTSADIRSTHAIINGDNSTDIINTLQTASPQAIIKSLDYFNNYVPPEVSVRKLSSRIHIEWGFPYHIQFLIAHIDALPKQAIDKIHKWIEQAQVDADKAISDNRGDIPLSKLKVEISPIHVTNMVHKLHTHICPKFVEQLVTEFHKLNSHEATTAINKSTDRATFNAAVKAHGEVVGNILDMLHKL